MSVLVEYQCNKLHLCQHNNVCPVQTVEMMAFSRARSGYSKTERDVYQEEVEKCNGSQYTCSKLRLALSCMDVAYQLYAKNKRILCLY